MIGKNTQPARSRRWLQFFLRHFKIARLLVIGARILDPIEPVAFVPNLTAVFRYCGDHPGVNREELNFITDVKTRLRVGPSLPSHLKPPFTTGVSR
jgi:hypothetical protein